MELTLSLSLSLFYGYKFIASRLTPEIYTSLSPYCYKQLLAKPTQDFEGPDADINQGEILKRCSNNAIAGPDDIRWRILKSMWKGCGDGIMDLYERILDTV